MQNMDKFKSFLVENNIIVHRDMVSVVDTIDNRLLEVGTILVRDISDILDKLRLKEHNNISIYADRFMQPMPGIPRARKLGIRGKRMIRFSSW